MSVFSDPYTVFLQVFSEFLQASSKIRASRKHLQKTCRLAPQFYNKAQKKRQQPDKTILQALKPVLKSTESTDRKLTFPDIAVS